MNSVDAIPIVFFAMVGAVLISFLYYRARMHTDNVLQSLAEKGMPIPTELFRKADRQDARAPYFARGYILLSAGLATVIFFWAVTSGSFGPRLEDRLWLPFLGVFPLFVGIACLDEERPALLPAVRRFGREKSLSDADIESRQAYADAGRINHRRITIRRAVITRAILRAVDHGRRMVIPTVPVVVIAAMVVPIRIGRRGESANGQYGGDGNPCSETCRQAEF